MFNGKLETMAPRVELFDGAVTIIRPLIYVPEKELVRYGQVIGFPEDTPCPSSLAPCPSPLGPRPLPLAPRPSSPASYLLLLVVYYP